MQAVVSECCVLEVVFSGAKNGTTERASPTTLSWQDLEDRGIFKVMLIFFCAKKE
jgi:hypothetical protein